LARQATLIPVSNQQVGLGRWMRDAAGWCDRSCRISVASKLRAGQRACKQLFSLAEPGLGHSDSSES